MYVSKFWFQSRRVGTKAKHTAPNRRCAPERRAHLRLGATDVIAAHRDGSPYQNVCFLHGRAKPIAIKLRYFHDRPRRRPRPRIGACLENERRRPVVSIVIDFRSEPTTIGTTIRKSNNSERLTKLSVTGRDLNIRARASRAPTIIMRSAWEM